MKAETGDFNPIGGPLHELGRKLHLVREQANSLPLGLAIAAVSWGVLVLLALIEGVGDRVFALSATAAHVRLLVLVPAMFLCEALAGPRMSAFAQNLLHSQLTSPSVRASLIAETDRSRRWRDAWSPEVICLLIAVGISFPGIELGVLGTTATFNPGNLTEHGTLTAAWYWLICIPLVRFLLLRWLWRLARWWHFLWRLARVKLHLMANHPDGVAGLGSLALVHLTFAPLAFALSAVQSASMAEASAAGSMDPQAVFPAIAVVLLINVVLFLAPLFFFTPRLWECRVTGGERYLSFAQGYVSAFNAKWQGKKTPPDDQMLGTPDLQSLADLGNSVAVVRNMRLAPVDYRLVMTLTIATILPMLPLLLLKYPVGVLVEKVLRATFGL